MTLLSNLNLIPVGVAIASIGILGFVVFFSNHRSLTNRTFLWLSLIAIFWNSFNYLAYQFTSLSLVLWLLRFVLFFAVWYCFFLFRFFYVYPQEQLVFPKAYRWFVIPVTALASLVVLTPLGISEVKNLPGNSQSGDVVGLGMILFGVTAISLIASGITLFIEKRRRAKDSKQPYNYILIGTLITFSLYIIFNFIFPVFLEQVKFIPYGAIFTFPFIGFASYTIIKHKFLGAKVVSTEILVFILSIAVLFELLVSKNISAVILRSFEFLLVLIFGVLLIRSVLKEVAQREKLQILSDQLAKANAQLKVLDQARSEFITIASHQLRTPPATIKWYLASVLAGDFGKLSPEVAEQLKKTEWTNNSQISLIDDLLNVSRIERGKMEFTFEPVDLLPMTQTTVDQLIPQAINKKLKLIFNKPKVSLPLITADKEKLRQVINNFIDNAIKYTKEGSVTVDLSKTAKELVLKVTDTGRGVRADQLDTLFEKFDRGKETAKKSTGLGLGLYVAKVIIAQHKGKIWVESPGEGRGSSFIFSLPIKNNLTETTFDLTKTQKPDDQQK